MMQFADPYWLVLLILITWPFLAERMKKPVEWSSVGLVPTRPKGFAGWPRHLPNLLRALTIGLFVVGLARPQTVLGRIEIKSRGIAMIVALDQSASMLNPDYGGTLPLRTKNTPTTRFDGAKQTLESFIMGRENDMIGLVAFATFPDLTCPPTLDHAFLIDVTRSLDPALPGESSTNLGDAVVLSLDALTAIPKSKKVLILLTDGQDSPGIPSAMDPRSAAELADDLGVTLHTIAIGKPGGVTRAQEKTTGLQPIVGIDDGPDLELLKEMAKLGGGECFEAANADALNQVFQRLDEIEKVPLTGTLRTRYREWYWPWVAGGLALLVLERMLVAGRWMRI